MDDFPDEASQNPVTNEVEHKDGDSDSNPNFDEESDEELLNKIKPKSNEEQESGPIDSKIRKRSNPSSITEAHFIKNTNR